MKLYTEEQVRYLIGHLDPLLRGDDWCELFHSLTPIELPSDEEIDEGARKYANINPSLVIDEKERYYRDFQKYDGHKEGAKWVIEQIKQQDDGRE